jgi:carbon storage regulator
MLVLKRKVGEIIMIGEDIQIQVLGVEGDSIKIGFVAPKEVQIMRKELYDIIRAENLHAGQQAVGRDQIMKLLGKHSSNTIEN